MCIFWDVSREEDSQILSIDGRIEKDIKRSDCTTHRMDSEEEGLFFDTDDAKGLYFSEWKKVTLESHSFLIYMDVYQEATIHFVEEVDTCKDDHHYTQ